MAKNKSLKVLSTASVAGMVAAAVVSSQAFAAVDAYSVKVDNDVFQYSKADLTDSFLASKAGEAAPLYEDFLARFEKASGFYAFHDNKTEKYVSVADITEKYLEAKAAGTEFVVDTYTESKDAKVLEVPTVKKVVVKDGKVVIEEDQATLKVNSVSAINAKTLKVNFNTAVADTSKVSFTVKKDATNVSLTAKWAEDKKSVELSRTANLATGDYTVTVAVEGYEFAEGTNVAKTKVEAQKVAKIEFVSPQLVKNSAGTAGTFRYKVYDQYGVDVTKDMASSKFSVSGVVGTTSVTPTLTPTTGVGSVTHTFATTDTKAVITIVDKATGASATATMDVAASVTVASLEFGEPVLPTGKVNIETGVAQAAKIPVTVTDQYGNKVTDLATLNSALTLISSSTGITPTFVVENYVPYIALDTTGISTKTTAVITAVNSANGKTFSNTYTVEKPAAAYSIELGDFSKEVLAVGDKNVVLDSVISDQFGNVLTPAQVVQNASTIEGWFNAPTYLGKIVVETDRNSVNYGKLVVKLVGDTDNDSDVDGSDTAVASTGSTEVIAVTPANLKVQTKTVVVSPARVVKEVGNVSGITLVQGATTNVKLALFDQYQATIKNADVTGGSYNNSNLTYKVFLTKTSGDEGAVTATVNSVPVTSSGITGSDEQYIASIPVTAVSDKTGTYALKVQLLNTDLEVVSEASTTVNVTKNNVAGITYSVADIPTLAGNDGSTYAAAATDGHAVAIDVSAKDANGNAYIINPADVVSVTTDNASAVTVAQAGDKTWYVAGKDVSDLTADQRKATLTITINTLDGFKTVTKDVTVSPAAPVIQELRVVNAALSAESRDLATDFPALANKLTYEFADKTAAITGTAIHIIGLDQYGCWKDLSNAGGSVVKTFANSTDLAPVDAFSVDSTDKLLLSGDAGEVISGKDILVTLTSGNASKQLVVKVTGSETLTANEAGTPDATFTVTSYTGYNLKVSHIDMDTSDSDMDSSITVNGLTYTVAVAGGTATVTVSGTATANAAQTTKTIKVIDPTTGANDTLTLTIGAVSANDTTSTIVINQ